MLMRFLFRAVPLLSLFFTLFCPTIEAAGTTPDIQPLIKQAQNKNLEKHPYWRQLLHYPSQKGDNDRNSVSEIITPGFFLSTEGRQNPSKELTATLSAFFEEPGNDQDNHAQCRFIARYKWLRKQLDWSQSQPPAVTCKRFNDWSMNVQIESLSLVVVTGYLSNPASFYGHILLKANPNRAIIPVDLLDQSINYGAIVPENENPLTYIANGLFGGYKATFSHAQFYRHNHNYGEDELRDMWEYELNLSADEIDQIQSHAWELFNAEFIYYFTRENCAYRMSELLEPAIGEPLFQDEIPWVMPTTIFDHLASIKRGDRPIVRQVKRIPSRQNRFYSGFAELGAPQKEIVRAVANNELSLNTSDDFINLPETDKVKIFDVLIDYYEFRILAEDEDKEFRRKKTALLIERSKLPPQTSTKKHEEEKSEPPHKGPLPTMLRAGVLNNHQLGSGIELQFRPAYYDLLTTDIGRIPNSKLTMFDLRVTHLNDKLKITSLDLVDIETLKLS